MKSIAAFYVLLAMEQAQQDVASRRAEIQESQARPQRPSILARARAAVVGRRAPGAVSNPI